MNREYHKWYSTHLNREMELLVFGHTGAPVIFFPTQTARFYDYENWKIIDSIRDKIEHGFLQVFCVDSVDIESFYCKCSHPSQRILRHIQYEQYILNEVLPFISNKNSNSFIITAGCSLGAYHAANIAFRHPHLFGKVVALSGRYDLTIDAPGYRDLFDGYRDENIYFNMPPHFIPNLNDEKVLDNLRKLQIIFVVGEHDPFLINNKMLHKCLLEKGVPSELYIWEGEAHRSKYWRRMAWHYL